MLNRKETSVPHKPDFVMPSREEFGKGQAGQTAYRLILAGDICGAKTDNGQCKKRATGTVDFDIPRINCLEQIPVCLEHSQLVQKQIIDDLRKNGYPPPSLGINGRGRS